MNDPIVDEVRRARDAHAARFNYDLDAIFKDLKEEEKRSGRNFVSFGDDGNKPASSSASGAEADQKKKRRQKKRNRKSSRNG
jgi:hypothetical protein